MIARDIFRLGKAVLGTKLMRWGIHQRLPYRINMLVTLACNSKCLTCGVWKVYEDNPYLIKNELSIGEYARLFKQLPELLWFNFAGGEPFLRKDLVEIINCAGKNCKSLMVIDTSTNGTLPDRIEKTTLEILKRVKIPHFAIGVSLDGAPELNDTIRGFQGDWYRAMETYKRLRSIAKDNNNFSTHINYTLSSYNVGKLSQFLKSLQDNGLDINYDSVSISIGEIGKQFFNEEMREIQVTDNVEQAIQDLQLMTKRGKLIGSNLADYGWIIKNIFNNLVKKHLRNSEEMVLPCAACYASCYIDPYGGVYSCLTGGMELGNLRDVDFNFQKLWFSDRANDARRRVKEGNCLMCWNGCESWGTILQSLPWVLWHLR